MKVECGNCGRVSDESELRHVFPDIPDLTERIAPGEPVPFGECPGCGALVHAMRGSFLCKTCGCAIKGADLREHLIEHNPNAEALDWEDVRNEFRLLSTRGDASPKAVIAVRGGVAEVVYCAKGMVVEIRDYDTDGCDDDELDRDGASVGVYEGDDE